MSLAAPRPELGVAVASSIGGPVSRAWREGTLTRAKELESLSNWLYRNNQLDNVEDLMKAVQQHIIAAREAARQKNPFRLSRSSSFVRAMGNLDAAEAQLLNFAPVAYILGQMPSLLNHVRRHLTVGDPRRQEFERIAKTIGANRTDSLLEKEYEGTVEKERGKIVAAVRGASSAALREELRVASFRNVLVVTTVVMMLLAVGVAIMGFVFPTVVSLCFQPEIGGQTWVVCPTAQSVLGSAGEPGPTISHLNDVVAKTVNRADLLVIETIGLTAAALAAAAAMRGIRGSSEPYGLPVVLAALKLPTGAITAFLGLLLMRGQFVPGLSALDTSAQIVAWAVIFGYAQQLFTHFVDQQAHTVLDAVRGGDKEKASQP
jgi:hypothetical protein